MAVDGLASYEAIKERRRARFRHVWRRDRWIYYIAGSFTAITMMVGYANGLSDNINLLIYPELAGLAMLTGAIFFLLIYLIRLLFGGHRRPVSHMIGQIAQISRRPEEIAAFAGICIAIMFFISAFTSFKSIIPGLNPFSWDSSFETLDRALHFGWSPWQLTHMLGGTWFTAGIAFLYQVWFFLYWSLLLFFLLRVDKGRLRVQYQIAHLASWIIIGGAIATYFSSAGPCYYGYLVDGPDPYVDLFERLNLQNSELESHGSWLRLWQLDIQQRLWNSYLESSTGIGSGISAMPSMHVGIAVLMALGCWRLHRGLGTVAWLYALLVQIGSVHLGWHYAVDGYLAGILVVFIWKMSGKLVERMADDEAGPYTIQGEEQWNSK